MEGKDTLKKLEEIARLEKIISERMEMATTEITITLDRIKLLESKVTKGADAIELKDIIELDQILGRLLKHCDVLEVFSNYINKFPNLPTPDFGKQYSNNIAKLKPVEPIINLVCDCIFPNGEFREYK